jgi:hypothetical protein
VNHCRRVVIDSSGIETRASFQFWDEPDGCPVYWSGGVRRGGDASLVCGFRMELGKACPDTATTNVGGERERSKRQNREELSTVAGCAGGLACSSREAPVTGVESRGQIVRGSFIGSTGLIPGGTR